LTTNNATARRRFHRLRAKEVAASKKHVSKQLQRHGTQLFVNVGTEDTNIFYNQVLSLETFPYTNMRLYYDAKFLVPSMSQKLSPLQAIQEHKRTRQMLCWDFCRFTSQKTAFAAGR
jgi:hypothetical protein